MINQGMMSSNKQDWETPIELFKELDNEFNFECDLFANDNNALCDVYFTEQNSAFDNEWCNVNFANPPYKTTVQNLLFERALVESVINGKTTVALVPARTDTKRFHKYVFNKDNVEIRFLEGRVKFCVNGIGTSPAPFPSCIIIWKGIK